MEAKASNREPNTAPPAGSAGERFAAAVASFEAIAAREQADPVLGSASILLHHGAPARRAFLFLHGFTSCPEQFVRLAESIHAAGYNVYVPLAPEHGRADRSARHLAALTPERIVAWLEEAVTLAAGLGEDLTVAGLSFGGVCSAWAACNLDAVDEAVVISPSFLPRGVPVAFGRILPAYLRLAPERLVWWDPVLKERRGMAPCSYRQLSWRGIGAVFELGQRAWHGTAQRTSPLARAVLVLNAFDLAISAKAARRAFSSAVEPLAQTSEIQRIGIDLRFPHDFLDPWGGIGEREPLGRQWLLDVLNVGEGTESLGVNVRKS